MIKMRRHLQNLILQTSASGSNGNWRGVRPPDWWEELLAVPGKEDAKRLAREVRASFTLPQHMQELDSREATLQAPPALPCLC